MNLRIITKNHAADSKIKSSQKMIFWPIGLTSPTRQPGSEIFRSEQNGMNPRLVLNITIARLKIGIFIKLILSLAYVVGGVWVNSVFVFRLMQLNVFVVPKM